MEFLGTPGMLSICDWSLLQLEQCGARSKRVPPVKAVLRGR